MVAALRKEIATKHSVIEHQDSDLASAGKQAAEQEARLTLQ